MADINIEKKRPSLWLWLVGLVLLVLVVYAAARIVGGDANGADTVVETRN